MLCKAAVGKCDYGDAVLVVEEEVIEQLAKDVFARREPLLEMSQRRLPPQHTADTSESCTSLAQIQATCNTRPPPIIARNNTYHNFMHCKKS